MLRITLHLNIGLNVIAVDGDAALGREGRHGARKKGFAVSTLCEKQYNPN